MQFQMAKILHCLCQLGGGKTICYAVPALMMQKVTIVVFPLLALLLDQVERMCLLGLNVCYFMSDEAEAD